MVGFLFFFVFEGDAKTVMVPLKASTAAKKVDIDFFKKFILKPPHVK